jgi:sugar/nucleoside kinase (ribokinase family)
MSLMNTPELRDRAAKALDASAERVRGMSAFVGLDGFVDEIIHAVDTRKNATEFTRLETISDFGGRITEAAGRSTNIEFVRQNKKLGGNGPIMANALATLGLKVIYVGALGYPNIHSVFNSFCERAEVHTIAESGHTDAVEFMDGKVMLVKSSSLNDITWANVQERYGRDRFEAAFNRSTLVSFVNWTMIPFMSDIWQSLLTEFCPRLTGPRRRIFFDLADPQKRPVEDIRGAMKLMGQFQQYFDVTLGLNEKESCEIGEVMGLECDDRTPEGLARMGKAIYANLKIDSLVIHPVTYAFAIRNGEVATVSGPRITKPLITTGAGDHFNSGFCLGQLLGLDNATCVLLGVATSGYYVKTAQTPTLSDLAGMLRNWPS